MANLEPIYSAKAKKIIEMVKYQTREEAAKELNYKTWKSLDMYMRRKNFVYDGKQGQYIPRLDRDKETRDSYRSHAPEKASRIIDAFNGKNPDPKEIAIKEGFKDHREMAEYMKTKGFEWNVYRENYIRIVGFKEEEAKEEIREGLENKKEVKKEIEVEEFMPFIRFLHDRREDVYRLLTGVREDGKIPRYAIPGRARTKAIYMSEQVAGMMAEFSQEKNVTQREIVETALVEYLQRYGFKQEVEALLQNRSW